MQEASLELVEGAAPAEFREALVTPHHFSRAERYCIGKSLRQKIPRELHAPWKPPSGRPGPVRLVRESDKGRLPELIPLRQGRSRRACPVLR
jgi:hypothetical protein